MTKLIEFKNHKGELLRGLFNKENFTKVVIFVHGFEHTTVEPKFKKIIDKLKGDVSTFRFDFSGCGLSDGKFSDLTVEKLTNELEMAIKVIKKEMPKIKSIFLVGHSLAGCVIVNYLQNKNKLIEKAVLFGPALNQEHLIRYYSTRGLFVGKKYINWDNWKKNFSELKFDLWLKKKNKVRKANFISNNYFEENKGLDYQNMLETVCIDLNKILIVQGTRDDKVPIASNDKLPKEIKQIIVKNSDHNFEKPEFVKQYLMKVVTFLKK